MSSAEIEMTVPFHDVDAMEVAWHGHYVRYFEIARCAALAKIAYDYPDMKASGYAWPIIDLHVRYPRPLEYGQKVLVSARLVEWENRMKFEYEIKDAASGRRLSMAETVQVAVNMEKKEMCFASPPILFQKLGLPTP
jgi:acyl-CoA thioester hydrolase